jgi:transcription elongation factor GreA
MGAGLSRGLTIAARIRIDGVENARDICKGGPMGDVESGGEAITAEGIAALREEIEQLEGPARTEMAARIKVARELGDLKENAEYHIAKEDQAHLETKIKRLRERLRTAIVVEVDGDGEAFAFGRTAEVLDESKGEVNTWTLVGSTEANLAEGRLSAESPIGKALRDARVSEPVAVETPKGTRTFVVQKLIA